MFPTITLLFTALITGAGACIAYFFYKNAKALIPNMEFPVKGRDLKKAVEEAIKPHMEQASKLERKLANAETVIKDLQVAIKLKPDPTPEQQNPLNKISDLEGK